jgi:hypothetical protein
MSPRDLVYVGHMLDMARKAVSKTQGISRQSYDADENLRLALIHLIQTIGEAARQVSKDFCSRHPDIFGGLTSSACATRSCTITWALMTISSGRSPRTICRNW